MGKWEGEVEDEERKCIYRLNGMGGTNSEKFRRVAIAYGAVWHVVGV